ncbi:TetR/AcrR family transcriptional regulator [Alcanivorax sp. JB21]|uniref:TetR/AcrR family transcriptional regulator n=1 Tax=Alcanivorax limicola TaxID=2874102 RepID=UPI001CC069F4|nr:TetR/AcrR family transcriptional regulator [Alcanivorax limicola]MBZ2188678.1 TetR/AcrR family transcriptional regulator [Alcanivorax limicola]
MRKRPRQARSKQMVATLIEATARCIVANGLDGTTTPRIAELAGVSVGSLYQYFEDKEALIDALVADRAAGIARGLRQLPVDTAGNLRDMVGGAIRYGFALLSAGDGLYVELIKNWHRMPTDKVADVLQQHFLELARVWFLRHYREYPIENLQVRIFIIVNSTLFTMVRLIADDHPLLPQSDVAEGLTDMIVQYLAVPS